MTTENIRPAELRLKLPETQNVEILAYDNAGTRLIVAMNTTTGKQCWTIVNDRDLYLHYDNFVRAIGDLYAITGIHDVGFAFRVWE